MGALREKYRSRGAIQMDFKEPRRISSVVIAMLFVFGAFAVVNFTSMNAHAEIIYYDWIITNDHQWRSNTSITLDHCNLTIQNGGILTFNNVTMQIICDTPGACGITIEANGLFEINNISGYTNITSDPDSPYHTYWFTNSGTIDFTDATVNRVYGPKDGSNQPSGPGGIVNEPGSVCKLRNCYA